MFDRHRLWVYVFGQRRVDLFPFDVGAIATRHDRHRAAIRVITQFLERFRGLTSTTTRLFQGEHFDGAVHTDVKDLIHLFEVRIGRAVFHKRTKATDARLNDNAIFGVRADFARQVQKHQRLIKVDRVCRPSFRQACTWGLREILRRFATLNIGTIATIAERDRIAIIVTQKFAVWTDTRLFHPRRAERTGKAAFGIIRTADERTTRARRPHGQTPSATVRASTRIAAVLFGGEKMRFENFVDLVENLGDPEFSRFCNRRREILPEPFQQVVIIHLTRRHFIKFVLKARREVILHILFEVVRQEDSDQTAFVLRDQATFILGHIIAVLNRGHDRGIGGRATDAQLFHLFDQSRLGVTRRRLGEVLLWQNLFLVGLVASSEERQTFIVVIHNAIVAAFFVNGDEAFEQNDLTRGTQDDLPVRR